MAAARDGKRCTKCGVFKPPEEFYVNRKLKNGGAILKSGCKTCIKRLHAIRNHKRNGRKGEYQTLQQIRENIEDKCEYCGRSSKRHRDGCDRPRKKRVSHNKLDPWERAISEQLYRIKDPYDPWMQRCKAAMVSLRNRAPKPKRPVRSKSAATWDRVIEKAVRQIERPKKEKSQWSKRIENAVRMLRRRTRHRKQSTAIR